MVALIGLRWRARENDKNDNLGGGKREAGRDGNPQQRDIRTSESGIADYPPLEAGWVSQD